ELALHFGSNSPSALSSLPIPPLPPPVPPFPIPNWLQKYKRTIGSVPDMRQPTQEPSSKPSLRPSVRTTCFTLRPESSSGSFFNLLVNFAFTSGVKRKFSLCDKGNQLCQINFCSPRLLIHFSSQEFSHDASMPGPDHCRLH